MTVPVRAVLFDFDGTLADSYPAITASVNHVRATYGLPPLAEADVCRHVGHGLLHLMEAVVPNVDPRQAGSVYAAHHPSVMVALTRLLPGVAEGLPTLHRQGVRLGVCSNKPVAFTRQLVDALGLAEVFGAVLGPEDVGRPKPAPDMLLAGVERLGVPKAEALYVGDMVVDIETGRAAGVRVWAVATGSEDRAKLVAAKPDRLLDDLRSLPVLLAEDGPPS